MVQKIEMIGKLAKKTNYVYVNIKNLIPLTF